LHLEMVKELAENYSFDEITEMQKEEMRNIPAEEIAANPSLQHIGQVLSQDELSEDSTEVEVVKR